METRPEQCISYDRFSTPAQADSSSFERQARAREDYIKQKGYELLEMYRDPGRSGWTGANRKKGALGQIIARLESGRIKPGTILLVEAMDRLSREHPFDALELIQKLIRLGMPVETIDDGRRYDRHAFAQGTIHSLIARIEQAHRESARKSELVMGGKLRSKREIAAGIRTPGHSCPSWLDYDPVARAYAVKEGAAETLQIVFESTAAGAGMLEVAKKLNRLGRPVFTGRGAGWHASTVAKLLRNRAVLGEYHPRLRNAATPRPVADTRAGIGRPYPALIEVELFERAQAARTGRQGKAGRKGLLVQNLLSGLTRCAVCGGSVVFRNKGVRWPAAKAPRKPRGPGTGAGLECGAAIRGLCENRAFHPYTPIEQTILDFVLSTAIQPAPAHPASPDLQTRRDALDRDLDAARAAFEAAFALLGGSASAAVKAKIEEAGARVDALVAQREALDREAGLARAAVPHHEHIAAIRRLRADAEQIDDLGVRRDARLRIQAALAAVIDHVTFHADRRVVVRLADGAFGGVHSAVVGPVEFATAWSESGGQTAAPLRIARSPVLAIDAADLDAYGPVTAVFAREMARRPGAPAAARSRRTPG